MTNAGTAPLTISAVTPTAEYAVTANTCVTTLAVSATCTFGVNFTPAATGTRTGTVTIANNGSTGSKVVNLTGTGQSLVSLSPNPVSFGQVQIGSGLSLNTTLTNAGAATISLTVPTASSVTGDDFAMSGTPTTCTTSLAAGASCTVRVRFNPTAAIGRTGTLTVITGAGNFSVSLSGTGTAVQQGDASLSPSTLMTFGPQTVGTTSAPQTVTITNIGTSFLAINQLIPSPEFGVTANTCLTTLAVGMTCTFGVSFTPGWTGLRLGALTVLSNGSSGVKSIPLNGTGN